MRERGQTCGGRAKIAAGQLIGLKFVLFNRAFHWLESIYKKANTCFDSTSVRVLKRKKNMVQLNMHDSGIALEIQAVV